MVATASPDAPIGCLLGGEIKSYSSMLSKEGLQIRSCDRLEVGQGCESGSFSMDVLLS